MPSTRSSWDHPVSQPTVTVSVVSHGHGALLSGLLSDLAECRSVPIELVLTINTTEPVEPDIEGLPYPVLVIRNPTPRGFGANHNAAFEVARGESFCVINPDVRFSADPFPPLLEALGEEGVGVAGPLVLNPEGHIEDSARRFPTVTSLLAKLVRRVVLRHNPEPDYTIGGEPISPDWIGGMCMVFRSPTFRSVGGFDERYFLYYEDVDLCWRLRRAGLRVVLEPKATVIHAAHRSSWKSWRYMRWHLTSMARFLVTQARGRSLGS